MILRRITEHVKAQNWTAVALDFVIVVVGVFIGIQVSNWNAARAERADELDVFGRLMDEAAEVRAALAEHREFHARNATQIIQLVARLEDKTLCEDFDDAEEKKLLLSVGDFPAPRFSLTTAAELASTGRVELLKSSDMQRSIREILVEINYVSEAWRRYVPIKQKAEEVYMAAGFAMTRPVVWDLSLDDPYIEMVGATEFRTLEQLCNRPDLVAISSNAANSQTFYVALLDQVTVKLNEYLDGLNAYAEGRWGPNRSSEAAP